MAPGEHGAALCMKQDEVLRERLRTLDLRNRWTREAPCALLWASRACLWAHTPCEDLWAHTPRTVSGGVRGDARHDLKVRVGATGAAASALQDGGDGSASREHGIKGAERYWMRE